MDKARIEELLYQSLETELGGVRVYQTAIRCAQNDDLRREWQKYLEETENHVSIVNQIFAELGLDPDKETPGRAVVRFTGKSLVRSMEMALEADTPAAAQVVAAEAVVHAETKDHANWELIGKVAENGSGQTASALGDAYHQVEEQEDQHLYHTMGWARELWIESLGMPAVLPPPEEQKQVTTAIGAARAEQGRSDMVGKKPRQ